MSQLIFTDFIKSLISETMSAVSESQFQQEQKILELKADLLATNNELSEKYELKEEAIAELGPEAPLEQIDMLVLAKIESIKEVMNTYFSNGFVKTILDKCKISANFIYSIDSFEENDTSNQSSPETSPQKISLKATSSLSKTQKAKLKLGTSSQLNVNSTKIFRKPNVNTKVLGDKFKIKTIDLKKDKDLIQTNQNLVSNIEIEFRTVIVD